MTLCRNRESEVVVAPFQDQWSFIRGRNEGSNESRPVSLSLKRPQMVVDGAVVVVQVNSVCEPIHFTMSGIVADANVRDLRDCFELCNAIECCAGILQGFQLSLIHISEPTRLLSISYAVFCLKK